MKKSRHNKAAGYAYRLLSLRPRSEKELKDRLFRKGFRGATARDVISSLKEKNVIDDSKFAKLWVQSRMRQSPKGDMLLRKELIGKGISRPAIDKALSEKTESEESACRHLAREKAKHLKDLPKEKARKRLFDYLARRGFSFSHAGDAVRENFDAEF